MTYELAKELKEAGWPQDIERGDTYFADDKLPTLNELDQMELETVSGEKNPIYCPTLSELVEACGEDFACLGKQNSPPGTRTGKWIALTSTDPMYNRYPEREGDTPEEAVARLWLALNKKI